MPELPEVEVVKRSLEKKIQNLVIKKVKINDGNLRYIVDKKKICKLSGMIVTKLDGTAKGGVILPIAHKYKLPIFAIGVGEQDDDLQPFDAENFTNTFLKK